MRGLARQVADFAALPVQQERITLWKSFNALRPARPMVLAFPEGGWRDLVTDADCQCQDQSLRAWELGLRRRIWHAQHIHDDHPVVDTFNVNWAVQLGDYGVTEQYHRTDPLGSHVWDPPLKQPADIKKLRPRTMSLDRAASQQNLQKAQGLFGDILKVRLYYHVGWPAMLSWTLIRLRGLDQVMLDIYDNPQFLHELMAFLSAERMRELTWLEGEGILSLNNGPDDYVGSGGLGCTEELPAAGFTGRVRLKDLWGFGESQEFVLVGPEHWHEFVLKYQLPILERFALNHYGCCEPLDRKYELLFAHVPRLRRLSISPWCDRELAARTLTDRYIFSWKPAPSMICAPNVNWPEVERYTRETVKIAKGCCIEMVMKDTHTFHGDASRIERWSRIASAAAQEA